MVFTGVFHGTLQTFYCNSKYKYGPSEILRLQIFVKEIVNFVVTVNIFIKIFSYGLLSKPDCIFGEVIGRVPTKEGTNCLAAFVQSKDFLGRFIKKKEFAEAGGVVGGLAINSIY